MLGLGIAISLIGLAYTIYELATREQTPPSTQAPTPASDPRRPGAQLKPPRTPMLPDIAAKRAAWAKSCNLQSDDLAAAALWTSGMFGEGLSPEVRLSLAENAVPLEQWPDFARRARCFYYLASKGA